MSETLASITCPVCGRTSVTFHDVRERAGGASHRFLDDDVIETLARHEPQRIVLMVDELARKALSPMELTLRPISVFQLTALVQVAMRHPGVSDSLRETVEMFLAGARDYFADCPTVLDVVRRGDDPAEDR